MVGGLLDINFDRVFVNKRWNGLSVIINDVNFH